MRNYDFSRLVKIKNLKLPGERAHGEVTPVERQQYLKLNGMPEYFREAAVLVWLMPSPDGAASVVLIRRTPDPGVHGGQISFPGGKKEHCDSDFYQTALRETREEVGAQPSAIELVRPLSSLYIPPSNFMVYPFLAFSNAPQELVPEPSEVDSIVYLPLDYLLNDRNYCNQQIKARYGTLRNVRTLPFEGTTIWGATLMVLAELRHLLRAIH